MTGPKVTPSVSTSEPTVTAKKPKGDLRAYNPMRSGKINHTKGEVNEKIDIENSTKYKSFSLNSYVWAEDYDPSTVPSDSLIPVQTMIITEFQPDFSYEWGETYEIVANTVKDAAAMVPLGNAALKGAELAFRQGSKSAANDIQNSYIEQPSQVVGMPMDFVKGLFAGTYQNSYVVPFFNDTYLKADTTGNWSAGGAVQALGETVAGILKEAMNVDFPTTPTWQLADVANRDAITVEFHLINNSTDALTKNFKFLNNIISGAFWMQLDYIQKSPNVYDIEVPGRFHSYYAALGVEVTHVGKLRTNKEVVKTFKTSLRSLNNETLFPDAYKMTLNIVDLCPNNFNNYIDYLKDGKSAQVIVGRSVDKYNTNEIAEKLAGNTLNALDPRKQK